MTDLQKCKDDLKHCYRKRINQKKPTRWPKLGDPTLYVDVTIVRAKFLSERFHEEYAMGLVDRRYHSFVTVDELLRDGHGKVVLIEGDPGAGKTTFTFQICKEWAEDKLLMEDIVFWIPLRHYKPVSTSSELFDKLGYPEMVDHAQKRSGKGFVLILDGWDELPNHLQTTSLFRDIIFGRIRTFSQSTIIVTSRPSCSSEIAEAVEETNSYYQILGFDQERAVTYINAYFYVYDDSSSAELLLAFLDSNEYLYRDFYIPISVAIMCFVYRSDCKQIPPTLSRLYERFVVLCLRSNIPNASPQDLAKFKIIHNVPSIIRPAFQKLCKVAFDMLKDNKLVLNEEELGAMHGELDNLQLKHFDGFGLLHVDHYTTTLATMETSYSFIHRAVQELLAAIFVLDTGNISDILDEHFYEDSYLMNVFPFLFGMASKDQLRPLAGNLIQIYNKSDRSSLRDNTLFSILYCLFEAHDETLCREFGQVFSEKRVIKTKVYGLLNCHYVYYFIGVCGIKRLSIMITLYIDNDYYPDAYDPYADVVCKYLQNTSTDLALFYFAVESVLSPEAIEKLAKALSIQHNIIMVKLSAQCLPGAQYLRGGVTILCNSIWEHNPQITDLGLPYGGVNESDLESVQLILTKLSLESLEMDCSLTEGVCLDLFSSFCKALCETKSLQKISLHMLKLSQSAGKVFGNMISQNCSLKELCITAATADCLDSILNGLSSNTSITTFKALSSEIDTYNTLGQCLERFLALNRSIKIVDFTDTSYILPKYVSWSSTQVCSICTGLCANTTVVTLDISGCYIDTEACHAVCGMLSQNTTLHHLFLNPVHLEKQEAITMIESCRDNDTLELLSLVQWPAKTDPIASDVPQHPFIFLAAQEIYEVLQNIQKFRQEKDKQLLNVYWLVTIAVAIHCVDICYLLLLVYREHHEYEKIKKQLLTPMHI